MTRKRKILFFVFLIAMGAFFVFVQGFATFEQKEFLGAWNIDKLFHIMGGAFIALIFEWKSPRRNLVYLGLFVAALAIGWEIFEVLFLRDVQYFRRISPDLWRFDVTGDIVSAFLGAYLVWISGAKKHTIRPEPQRT